MVAAFIQYYFCYFSFILKVKSKNAVAFKHLIHYKTHRIPKGKHWNLRTALGIIINSVYLDIVRKNGVVFNDKGDVVIYNEQEEKWIFNYIEKNDKTFELAAYITPNSVYLNYNIGTKLTYLLATIVTQILALPILLVRPPAIWALHFKVFHEHVKIMSMLNGRRINKFYDLLSYEIGSSFLCLLLQKKGIRDYYITSPTPLYETYPDCVSDVFLSTSPYHQEEIEFKKVNEEYPLNFYYNSILHWPYNEYDDKLEHNTGSDYGNKKVLGVYVSGVWWRNKESHQEFAEGFFKSEFLLLEHIREFIIKNPEFRLMLFLHPRERRTKEQLEEGLKFYHAVLKGISFELMDFSQPTKAQFSKCDVSISVSSNTTYERLYGGFKSIFTPYYLPNFPIKGNALEYICAKSYEALEQKILQFSNMDTETYFEMGGLKKYHSKYSDFYNKMMTETEVVF